MRNNANELRLHVGDSPIESDFVLASIHNYDIESIDDQSERKKNSIASEHDSSGW